MSVRHVVSGVVRNQNVSNGDATKRYRGKGARTLTCGSLLFAAMSPMLNDIVLLARIQLGLQAFDASWNTDCLASSLSTMAWKGMDFRRIGGVGDTASARRHHSNTTTMKGA